MKNYASIEPLEPRIAPATISIVGKTATWTDFDGDIVTMKWTSADAPAFTTMDKDAGLLVSRILLDPAKHTGAGFTVNVKAGGVFGDGRVELGHLDGAGVALKSWVGAKAAISELDLGVSAGDGAGTFISGGIGQTKSSFFAGAMGDGQSNFNGNTKVVKIVGDIGYGGLILGSNSGLTHDNVTVTGSLRGNLAGGTFLDGYLSITGSGKSVIIGGSIVDGFLGQSFGVGSKSVTVRGDVVCTTGFPESNGAININTEKLSILGSVLGGSVAVSGTDAGVKSVSIGGSIVAKNGVQKSGLLYVGGATKSITVKGSVRGAEFATYPGGSGSFGPATGAIVVFGNAGAITVGGSIFSGKTTNEAPAVNGGIDVIGNVGSISIKGGVFGREKAPVFILASGNGTGATKDYNSIGKLSIKGDAVHAYIAAGTSLVPEFMGNGTEPLNLSTVNPDAGIGSIFIGGNFNTSNVFAGVADGGSRGVNNLAVADTLAVGNPALAAKLGPVVIKGHLLSERDSSYFSGFAADSIASITVNGRKVFTAGDGLRNFDTFITAREL